MFSNKLMGEFMITKNNWNEFMSIIRAKKTDSEELKQERKNRILCSLFLMGISFILTILNICNGWWFMAATTSLLVLGFSASAWLAGASNNLKASSGILSLVAVLLFTIYIISGENEGFAALWVLLVPMISMNLIEMELGIWISLYYLVLLVVLFYTPLHRLLEFHYTSTFMIRFPILYFASFGASAILVFQKQYYFLKVQQKATYDDLTGMSNRHVFMQHLNNSDQKEHLIIAFIDLNRLKLTNDTLGHVAGDEMIQGVAQCMLSAFPSPLISARIGGDEFAVIADMPREEWNVYLTDFESRIAAWRGHMVEQFSVAIGCAYREDHPTSSAEELLTIADTEMYKNKVSFLSGTGQNP